MGDDGVVGKTREHPSAGGLSFFSEFCFFALKIQVFNDQGFIGFFCVGNSQGCNISDDRAGLVGIFSVNVEGDGLLCNGIAMAIGFT